MVWNHIIWFAAIYMVANQIYGKIPYNKKCNLILYGHIYGHIVWPYTWSTIHMFDPWITSRKCKSWQTIIETATE